jgi:ribonuclease III
LNEGSKTFVASNERLEFLGDAVLELTITTLLYHAFPTKQEGELTDIRSALVRGKNLAVLSQNLHFENFVLVSR